MSKPEVALTVDVEAHPIRASEDHINRLIWGRQNGAEAGIRTMMDIADRHGVKMTFFLDYPEYELYGEDLLDVGREIVRRGHDLEPHCHAEYLLKPLFNIDDEWSVRLPQASRGQSDKIVKYLLDKHRRCGAQSPLAYRSGAYLIGSDYLDALKEHEIRLDASYNILNRENPFQIGLRGQFNWSNNLREIPIPFIPYFNNHNHLVAWNFNHKVFLRGSPEENVAAHKRFLEVWFQRHGKNQTPTLVMHSWSFWGVDDNGHITKQIPGAVETFDALLKMLRENYEIVTLDDAAKKGAPENLESVSPNDQSGHCPICFEPLAHLEDQDEPRRRCAFCHSLERHRALERLVYSGRLGPWVFAGKDILHLAPSLSEKLLLRRSPEARVTTLDIMLDECDIKADLQNMPEIPGNSYDIVLASGVFRHVRNLDAALSEVRRILRPGGLLICNELAEKHDHTLEISDPEDQTRWYGMEILKKYNVGTFRSFGRKDWTKPFQKYFYVRELNAADPATGLSSPWLAATPRDKSCA